MNDFTLEYSGMGNEKEATILDGSSSANGNRTRDRSFERSLLCFYLFPSSHFFSIFLRYNIYYIKIIKVFLSKKCSK